MNLKPIIQSEVSQKEKNNYYTLTHIYAIKKDGTDGPICKAVMETEQTYGWRESAGQMEKVAWKQVRYHGNIASGNLLYISGNSNHLSVTT